MEMLSKVGSARQCTVYMSNVSIQSDFSLGQNLCLLFKLVRNVYLSRVTIFVFRFVLFVNCSSDLYSYPELIDGITSMSMI